MIRKIDSNIFSLTILKVTTFSRIRQEKGAKQVAPAQDHVILKFENDEDGKYSQAMIAQIIKHFHLPNNTVVLLLLHHS